MKDSFYFPHDYNAANDPRILRLRVKFGSADGYAMFFMTLEAMAQQEGGILLTDDIAQLGAELGFSLKLDENKMIAFLRYSIEIGLFIQGKGGIYTNRMVEHKNFRKERAKTGSRGGKRAAKNRLESSSGSSSGEKEVVPRKGKERKEKEITKETTNVVGVPPVTYGNDDVNKILKAIKLKVGIDDFSDSQKWQRSYGKHCFTLMTRISPQEFERRLGLILKDSFKRKRCNEIKYVYDQIKGFIEPNSHNNLSSA